MKLKNEGIRFRIDHVDPLGQGVDKKGGDITFIAKTLPGETGTAQVCKSKKGVRFAKLLAIENSSEKRIAPECPHYEDCPGCDYLHTDYESEIAFKTKALKKSLQKIPFDWDRFEVLAAPERLGYRNRIQLHYREGKIGLVDGLEDRIVEIPECRIVHTALRPALKKLYTDQNGQKKYRSKGHCEIYFHQDKLKVSWNKAYAQGGFSQVNAAMNAVLRSAVAEVVKETAPSSLLDLFSGNGNLSDGLVNVQGSTRIRVDAAPARPTPDFVRLDLLKPFALKVFERKVDQKRFDVLLVDPPRRGFPALKDWVLRYRPKVLVYVSCHPGTLARDLERLQTPHEISRLMLIDLFPGTRHFETLTYLCFRNGG
ncbi:MAG: class I SAM-dependent RNA methyltransferase [Nitrospiria bacterium]